MINSIILNTSYNKNSNDSTLLDLLPDEIVFPIFSRLDALTLGRLSCVNRHFKQISDDPRLWEPKLLVPQEETSLDF